MSAKNSRTAAPPAPPAPAGRPVAEWMLLLSMGGISAWFNIQDNAGKMHLDVAIGAGIAPVLAAMLSSHIVAKYRYAEKWLRIATFAVMVGAMALSAQAVGDVVRPGDRYLWWLFGPVVDAAELIALYMLLTHAAASRAARRAAERASSAQLAAAQDQAAVQPAADAPEPDLPQRGKPAPVGLDRTSLAEKARKAYRISKAEVAAGRARKPLSDRALGNQFGKSRTWGASRIAEVEHSHLGIAATGTDRGRP
jgi:hypothetical protein